MKKFTAIICTALASALLFSCNKSGEEMTSQTDAATTDWRNTITYNGSVYVNKETKVLYRIDKGSITIWDNAGDGAPLQSLSYDTYYDKVLDALKFTDVNQDGHMDILLPYSIKEGGASMYNLWLWNNTDHCYTSVSLYKTIYDPVVSADGKVVCGTKDMGMFGKLVTEYTFTDDLSLSATYIDISNAEEIASNMAKEITGNKKITVSKADGKPAINESSCKALAVSSGEQNIAYLAYTTAGEWYIDTECIDVFRKIEVKNDHYILGTYADTAGEAFERASAIYNSKYVEIYDTVHGKFGSTNAVGFCFRLDGKELCTIIRADNGVWYGTEGSLESCSVVSASGDFEYVKGETYNFKLDY